MLMHWTGVSVLADPSSYGLNFRRFAKQLIWSEKYFMLPAFEADGHLKIARVNFPRVIRGSGLDPEYFIGSL